MPEPADERHFLYELCVQRPETVVRLLRTAAAGTSLPRVLHEDFSGTGAISRAWIATDPTATAIATDLDAGALSFGRRRAAESFADLSRIEWRCADVRETWQVSAKADAIFVGNFSIGELHARADLVAYLRSARERLSETGVFICDTYGGAAAFRTGLVHRTHPGREPGERILYTWEQRTIDPYTARVVNALHFRVERSGEIIAEHFDAFVYHWRLWPVPELRDAMQEAGFASCRVIERIDGSDPAEPTARATDAAEHHIVCVCGHAA